MEDTMPTIPELIVQWRNKQINGSNLMRALVSHKTWSIPVSEAAAVEMLAKTNEGTRIQYNRDAEGTNRVMLFSSSDTLNQYRKNSGIEGSMHFMTTTGTWVFRMPLEGIDQIWIDPLTADDIFYDREQFDRLHRMADAVEVEEAITGLRQGTPPENALQIVKKYQNYWVPVGVRGDAMRLVMAPDDKGRSLAAVFTYEDTCGAFLPMAQAHETSGRVEERVLAGPALYSILNTMPIDGMVFNCNGPVAPVAFAKGFAQVVLDA